MIRSFRDRDTERLFNDRRVRRYEDFASQALRRLIYLDDAEHLMIGLLRTACLVYTPESTWSMTQWI